MYFENYKDAFSGWNIPFNCARLNQQDLETVFTDSMDSSDNKKSNSYICCAIDQNFELNS